MKGMIQKVIEREDTRGERIKDGEEERDTGYVLKDSVEGTEENMRYSKE